MSIRKEFDNFKKEMSQKVSKLLKEEFAKIFQEYPDAKSFSFTGYVDYFADGDECRYYTRPYRTTINGLRVGELYGDPPKFDSVDADSEEIKQIMHWAIPFYKEMWKIIDDIPEDILQQTYGSHSEMVVDRNGDITIEDASDHD